MSERLQGYGRFWGNEMIVCCGVEVEGSEIKEFM